MYICDRCQKGRQVGMNVSHSHRRTKRKTLPNLHVMTVRVEGKNKTMRLCTKCLRLTRIEYPRVARGTEVVEKKATPAVKSETPKEELAEEKEVATAV